MNIPHSEEEKEEDFLEYLYMGWKSGTEIWPHQVKMHLELMDAELKRLERGLMASGYLRKRAAIDSPNLEKYRVKNVFCVTTI